MSEKEEPNSRPEIMGVRHVGVLAKNPAKLANFYRDVMGMKIVRQTSADSVVGATAFLGRHPEKEDHDVVLVSNKKGVHTAFRVASLGELLAFYRWVKDQGITIRQSFNHVVEFSFYFDDPEGNLLEIYWVTGLSSRDARADPIDLELSEQQLRAEVDRLAVQFGMRH